MRYSPTSAQQWSVDSSSIVFIASSLTAASSSIQRSYFGRSGGTACRASGFPHADKSCIQNGTVGNARKIASRIALWQYIPARRVQPAAFGGISGRFNACIRRSFIPCNKASEQPAKIQNWKGSVYDTRTIDSAFGHFWHFIPFLECATYGF